MLNRQWRLLTLPSNLPRVQPPFARPPAFLLIFSHFSTNSRLFSASTCNTGAWLRKILHNNGVILGHTLAYSTAISLPLYFSRSGLTSGASKIAIATEHDQRPSSTRGNTDLPKRELALSSQGLRLRGLLHPFSQPSILTLRWRSLGVVHTYRKGLVHAGSTRSATYRSGSVSIAITFERSLLR
jgi:hypothetical protein